MNFKRSMRIPQYLLCIVLTFVNIAGASEYRLALVIGNSSYTKNPLSNPVNDAVDVAMSLKELGFEVILKTNTTFLEMENSVREFGNNLKESKGIGLFYYAGHGLQVNGNNYLIPVDADIQDEFEVKHKALDVDLVLDQMETAENDVNLLILDACRNNPFALSFRSTQGRGLAQMSASSGTVIWYATRPGKVALDGEGRNSPFTSYLIPALQNHRLKAREVISNIAVKMHNKGYNQEPWQEGIWLKDFYFTLNSNISDSAGVTTLKSRKNTQLAKIDQTPIQPPANNIDKIVSIKTINSINKVDLRKIDTPAPEEFLGEWDCAWANHIGHITGKATTIYTKTEKNKIVGKSTNSYCNSKQSTVVLDISKSPARQKETGRPLPCSSKVYYKTEYFKSLSDQLVGVNTYTFRYHGNQYTGDAVCVKIN